MGSLSRKIQKSQNESTVRRIKSAREAYQEGWLAGLTAAKDGIDEALFILFTRIASMDQVKDIGPKRYQALLHHFNYKNKEELLEGIKERPRK